MYQKKNQHSQFIDSSDTDSYNDIHRYQFAIDLQKMDNNPDFHDQVVVAIEVTNQASFCTWSQLKKFIRSGKINEIINGKIRVIPRTRNGQVYIFDGFRTHLHFSIGPKAWKEMKSVLLLPNYAFDLRNETMLLMSAKKKRNDTEFQNVLNHAKKLAIQWLPYLLSTKKSNKRVPFHINIGYTDMK